MLRFRYRYALLFVCEFLLLSDTLGNSKVSVWDPHLKMSVVLDSSKQHIPRVSNSSYSHQRPPRPLLPKYRTATIFIGISSFRDGKGCGNTLYTAFSKADDASRVYVGIVDQTLDGDPQCLQEYCNLAYQHGYVVEGLTLEPSRELKNCPHIDQIRVLPKDARSSKGTILARSWQQSLIKEEDFCLQVDAHSLFMESWDSSMLKDWLRTNNEMAILSTYITDFATKKSWPKSQHPHICSVTRGTNGMVKNDGASIVSNIRKPQLSSFWGAGLSFGKCHSEHRVKLDPQALWVSDGEEFLKAARLWTAGYDIYSPTAFNVYHDYESMSHRAESLPFDEIQKSSELKMGINRMKMYLGMPFEGQVSTEGDEKYKMAGVRSFSDYLSFAGVNLTNHSADANRCLQLYWRPYTNFTEIRSVVTEQLNNNWMFYPPYDGKAPPVYQSNSMHTELEENKSLIQVSHKNLLISLIGFMILLLIWCSCNALVSKRHRDTKHA